MIHSSFFKKTLVLSLIFFVFTQQFLVAQKASQVNYINKRAVSTYPKSFKLVNDFENLLTPTQIKDLESLVRKSRIGQNQQVMLVTVPTYLPYSSMGDFSKDLMHYWHIGEGSNKQGLVILFSKKSRSVRIMTSYNGIDYIPQSSLQSIINNDMLPRFRKKNIYGGLREGLEKCLELCKANPVASR